MKDARRDPRRVRVRPSGLFRSVVLGVAILLLYSVAAAEWQWPRDVSTRDTKVTIYQPQIESLKGDKVSARAAVSVKTKDSKDPTFGVVWIDARVLTDRDARTVEFVDVAVESVKFPKDAPEREKTVGQNVLREPATWKGMDMSLDRLLTMTAAAEREKLASEDLNTAPPRIVFSTTPSILVVINGKPVLRPVEDTKIEQVVNTPYVMLFDPGTREYYLKGGDLWFSATELTGKWERVARPSQEIVAAGNRVSESLDPVQRDLARTKLKEAPQIVVATEPTELIYSEGQPQYGSVQDTDLLYITNSPNDVFLDAKTKQYFVVLAGRWYQSASLEEGPWKYVPPDQLPRGFYRILPGTEKGHVLAFVADTRQAEEAVLDAQIPQTAAVKRTATLNVTYDGAPKFERVKGAAVDYAVNTGTQVIRVRDRYYACDKAVWFVADSPKGPWTVADSLPEEIRDIPPDSPVYNLKFVRIYDSSPEVVYVGYTPGYLGSYVYGGTVVYGTGYYYPDWVGTAYYPAPVTWGLAPIYYPYYGAWGFGAGFVSGAFFGFAAGVIASPWWGWGGWWGWAPWWGWGGWWGHHGHGSVVVNKNVIVNRPGHPGHGSRAWDRPRQNLYNRPENAGRLARGVGGTRVDQRAGLTQNRLSPQPSAAARGVSPDRRTGGTRQGSVDQRQRMSQFQRNDVFAGRDGSVFRRTDRGWEQRTQSRWARPEALDRSGFNRTRPNLERDFSARSRGFERETTVRNYGPFFRGGMGPDGFGRGPYSSGMRGGSGDFRGGAPGGGAPRGGMPGSGFSGAPSRGSSPSSGGFSGGGSGRGRR